MTNGLFCGAGFHPRVAIVATSNETIKQAVIAGMGLALISEHTVSLELALGLVGALPVENFPLMRSWFVVRRRTLPLLPAQAKLRDYLVEQGDAVIPELVRNHVRIASAHAA